MPASATRPPRPLAVLFACGQNSVRSPIAAGLFAQMFGPAIYVASAGVRKGELDPFAVAAMTMGPSKRARRDEFFIVATPYVRSIADVRRHVARMRFARRRQCRRSAG